MWNKLNINKERKRELKSIYDELLDGIADTQRREAANLSFSLSFLQWYIQNMISLFKFLSSCSNTSTHIWKGNT